MPEEAAVWVLNDHDYVVLQTKFPDFRSCATQAVGLADPVCIRRIQVGPAFRVLWGPQRLWCKVSP